MCQSTQGHVLTPEMLATFGTTLVIAPHPDDETLGCGGLIAMLRAAQQPVWVLLASDGAASHPRSIRFDAAARTALRAAEMRDALACLGVPADHLLRLDLPDGDVPGFGAPTFAREVERMSHAIAAVAPQTLLLPWRRDPHPDHRATNALARAAAARIEIGTQRTIEYMVWTAERAQPADRPQPYEGTSWQLDISGVVSAKACALAAHRSQLGLVIDDDAAGFTLGTEMRERAALPTETYFESSDLRSVAGRPRP